jgi:hypothetical protein
MLRMLLRPGCKEIKLIQTVDRYQHFGVTCCLLFYLQMEIDVLYETLLPIHQASQKTASFTHIIADSYMFYIAVMHLLLAYFIKFTFTQLCSSMEMD